MSRSLAQQKIDLAQNVLNLSKSKDIKAVAVFMQNIESPFTTLSPEEEEDVRLGEEDFAAGRTATLEEALEAMRSGIQAGIEKRAKRHAKAA